MDVHRMEERLDAIITGIVDDKPTAKQKAKMEALDRQMIELQTHAERRCRKIIKPLLEFSPKVKLWHERVQAYKKLIRWKSGNARNGSNIIRSALRNGIPNPRELSLVEMERAVDFAKAQKRLLRGKAPEL